MNTAITKEQELCSPLPGHGLFSSLKKRRQLLALSLFALTLLAYNPASHFQFLNYDDPHYITENSYVQTGLHWGTLGWAFTTFDFFNWHPLTWISLLLDYQFFKLNPAGYHFMNVVYHALAAVLLFLVLQRATGYLGRSFAVALLFALHPLNIQSVAWVSERKNVLSAIFWLLAIWAYGWYALRPSWKRYLTVAVCFALGLMAKATVLTLPCALLLLDLWPLRRVKSFPYAPGTDLHRDLNFVPNTWLGLALEKIPLLFLSAASAVLTFLALHSNGGPPHTPYPLAIRIENAVVAYVLYISKTFFPVHLAIIYPHPGYGIPLWKFVVCAIVLLGITLAVLRFRRQRPYLLVGWLWFLGTLAPVSGLFQYGDWAMADRYAYLPLLGIFLMLVWGGADWVERTRARKMLAAAFAAVLLTALVADTRHELGYWHDTISLFSRALSVTQNNDVAETNLGEALSTAGKEDEAALHFLNALRSKPDVPAYHYNYGRSLLFTGKPQQAIEEFKSALQLGLPKTTQARAYHNMGVAFREMGRRQEAELSFERAIQSAPEGPSSRLALGLLEFQDNRFDAALDNIQKSVRLQPSDIGYFVLAQIYERQGRSMEAKAAYEKAAQISPDLRNVLHSLEATQEKMQSHQSSVEPATPEMS